MLQPRRHRLRQLVTGRVAKQKRVPAAAEATAAVALAVPLLLLQVVDNEGGGDERRADGYMQAYEKTLANTMWMPIVRRTYTTV